MPVVSMPPADVLRDFHAWWQGFADTVREAGWEVAIDPALGRPGPLAFEFRVDGRLAVYDFSEYVLVEGPWQDYDHWFKRTFTSGHLPYRNMHPLSVLLPHCDWTALRRVRAECQYTPGDAIAHKQSIFRVPHSWPYDDLFDRRTLARTLLVNAFGSRVDTQVETSQEAFFRTLCLSLVSVHIPGTWQHQLDRAQRQAWCLGVCTISPDLQMFCGPTRPQAWEHYVPIRDDFADLVERVRWCDEHRDECWQIGARAQQLFDAHVTPTAAWNYVLGILND